MKYLITQALDERDLLKKKIGDKIEKFEALELKKNSDEETLKHGKAKEFEEKVKAEYRSIMDLIKNREQLEKAIVKSNAETMVEVNGEKMSIAEALVLKKDYEGNTNSLRYLEHTMSDEYNIAIVAQEKENKIVEDNAYQLKMAIAGNTEEAKDNTIEMVKTYEENNRVVLVDPINAKDKAQEIKEHIEKTISEINTAVKVSNATTYIEI